MIVVVDTNVWISALHFGAKGGTTAQALERAVRRDTIATCDEMDAEIVRVFVEKFGVDRQEVEAVLRVNLKGAVRVKLEGTVQGCRDPHDDMFLECAAKAHADLIVAGDKDLLVLGSFGRARIVTPAEYVAFAE